MAYRYQVFTSKGVAKPAFSAPWHFLASFYASFVRGEYCQIVDSEHGVVGMEWSQPKQFGGGTNFSGVFRLGKGITEPTSRMGKDHVTDTIFKALALVAAQPGDIVEINEHGVRIVGRRPHLANEQPDVSEQAIREALKRIYGNDAASLENVSAGANVVVFRNLRRKLWDGDTALHYHVNVPSPSWMTDTKD